MSRASLLMSSLAAVMAAAVGGCAGGRPVAEDVPRYPEWVRIVPAETDEIALYVGGASIAPDASSGLERATADALSQLELDARSRFYALFDRAAAGARGSTSLRERERLRADGAASYSSRIEAAVERADVFQRSCDDSTEALDAGEPVCETFVLLRLDGRLWDPLLAETLAELRKAERDAGRAELAGVVEHMLRALE